MSGKIVLSSIAKVLLVAFLISAYFGLYVFGYLKGFNEGSLKEAEKFAAAISSQNEKKTSSSIDPLPTATPTPGITVVRKAAAWGGPDLWSAVNIRRVELGVNPLNTATELCTIASIRLNELLDLKKLDGHEGFSNMTERRPDLNWIFEKYNHVAEFLAVGGDTAVETVSLWENTLGHSKLLKGGEYVWGCIYAQNTFAVAITAY